MNLLTHEIAYENAARCARLGESPGERFPAFGVPLVRMSLSASLVTLWER